MTNRLLTAPTIIAFSAPAIIPEGFLAFIAEHDLHDLAANTSTPIGKIANHVVVDIPKHSDAEILVEFAGRQCYRAWKSGRETPEYIDNIIGSMHGSVLAHAHFSFAISGVSRTLTHELIRHAAGVDISEESQRYVDAEQVRFVVPPILLHMWDNDLTCSEAQDWFADKMRAVVAYNRVQAEIEAMLEGLPVDQAKKRSEIVKRANEAARADLPNACETRLVWTVNARALRHILMLRGDPAADLEIKRFATMLTPICKALAPAFFNDIEVVADEFGVGKVIGQYVKV